MNGVPVDSEISGELMKGSAARVSCSYCGDFDFGELGAMMLGAALDAFRSPASWFVPAFRRLAPTPFSPTVSRVVLVSPEPQVGRIDAGRIVAMVKDAQAFRDRAEVMLPGEAMGGGALAFPSEHPVSLIVRGSCPRPTLFGASLVNLRPEAPDIRSVVRDGCGRIITHREAFLSGVTPPAARTVRGQTAAFQFGTAG